MRARSTQVQIGGRHTHKLQPVLTVPAARRKVGLPRKRRPAHATGPVAGARHAARAAKRAIA
jgi:hypothetical protein